MHWQGLFFFVLRTALQILLYSNIWKRSTGSILTTQNIECVNNWEQLVKCSTVESFFYSNSDSYTSDQSINQSECPLFIWNYIIVSLNSNMWLTINGEHIWWNGLRRVWITMKLSEYQLSIIHRAAAWVIFLTKRCTIQESIYHKSLHAYKY